MQLEAVKLKKEWKKPIAGSPRPRIRCERKMTHSPSSGAGDIFLFGAVRARTRCAPGRRRVLGRKSMRSSSTTEPSHAPERMAGATAAEEELIAGWCGVVLLADGKKKERGGKRKRGSGRWACVLCRSTPPYL